MQALRHAPTMKTCTNTLFALIALLKPVLVVFGGLVIATAAVTWLWELDLGRVYGWLSAAFGPLFLVLYTGLVLVSCVAIIKIKQGQKQPLVWHEVGVQSASGIATLALTFTLLGISLGIESLSQQSLSPETIGLVIQDLTKHFSMAFMTTVLGLPSAHILRSLLAVQCVALEQKKIGE